MVQASGHEPLLLGTLTHVHHQVEQVRLAVLGVKGLRQKQSVNDIESRKLRSKVRSSDLKATLDTSSVALAK